MGITQKQHNEKIVELLTEDPSLIKNQEWRLNNLYFIITKDGEKTVFSMNRAQKHFYDNYINLPNPYHRHVILKSRQLGMTTFIDLFILDAILFKSNKEGIIIAHKVQDATEIFDKKIEFAIRNMSSDVKDAFFRISHRSARKVQVVLDYGPEQGSTSSITVAVSGRSGTYHYVHISEFAKMCVAFPKRADEVERGTFPTVPFDGFIFIESTAEGMAGRFYEIFQQNWLDRETITPQLSQVQFLPHFYNWQYDDMEMKKIYEIIPVSKMAECEIDWASYQEEHNLTDKEMTYYYMKWLQFGGKNSPDAVKSLMQEYPTTCVVGDTLVDTINGLEKIESIVPDGKKIIAKYDQGVKEVFEIETKMGYSLQATADHRVMLDDGTFAEVKDLMNKKIELGKPKLGGVYQTIEYNSKPFLKSSIEVNEDFGRFLGYFMGDGSISGDKGTISIACDGECMDVVKDVSFLIQKYFGEPHIRITGDKKGCVEVRTSSKEFIKPFFELGVMRRNSGGGFKRKVCVPEYIEKSPKSVVVEFLKGLFEADGFCDRSGNRIIFFTKYKHFARDIQVLLLSFGVTCKLNTAIKKAGNGSEYIGYELRLRKQETLQFKKELNFISKKKNDRLNQDKCNQKYSHNEVEMKYSDEVISIIPVGKRQVWDITTKTHTFIANGIVVHNCEEAFLATGQTYFPTAKAAKLLQEAIPGTKGELGYDEEGKLIFNKVSFGSLEIFKEPEPGAKYIIGGDTAEGLAHGDAQVLYVINHKTENCDALYISHVAPDELANEAYKLGKYYNFALMGIEVNKDGLWVNDALDKLGYVNMYYRKVFDDITKKMTKFFGWKTTSATRPFSLAALKAVFFRKDTGFPAALLNEMFTFVRNEKGKPEAMAKHNDDVILAAGIAYAILQEQGEFMDGNTGDCEFSHMKAIFNEPQEGISQMVH